MFRVANRWYVVLSSREVGADRAVGARRLGRDLVFWRDAEGVVQAANDRCPHRRAALAGGRVIDGAVECPFHGFRFGEGGGCVAIPAHPDRPISGAMSLETVAVREAHGFVWQWTGPDPVPDAPIPFFDFGDAEWSGSEFVERVDTHYTRAIENQLDVAHLRFVHAKSIGRLLPEGPIEVQTEVEGDLIRFRPQDDAELEFLGPNIWRNRFGRMWQFLAMVPIDAEHTQYYVRTYQQIVRAPGLSWMLGKLLATSNRYVLSEDKAVVESQPVEETRLRMGEVLLPSDMPIIAFRRWREARRWDGRSPLASSAA
jgi:phenylpropionate dioxygenase-like ring-hydroxylating dioxygenase large terminal subunit